MGYRGTVEHIAEDSLEQYAMGAFPEPEAGPLEEHLLICAACQNRLQTTDDYVAALRGALRGALRAGNAEKKPAVTRMAVRKADAPAPAVKRASGN